MLKRRVLHLRCFFQRCHQLSDYRVCGFPAGQTSEQTKVGTTTSYKGLPFLSNGNSFESKSVLRVLYRGSTLGGAEKVRCQISRFGSTSLRLGVLLRLGVECYGRHVQRQRRRERRDAES